MKEHYPFKSACYPCKRLKRGVLRQQVYPPCPAFPPWDKSYTCADRESTFTRKPIQPNRTSVLHTIKALKIIFTLRTLPAFLERTIFRLRFAGLLTYS